MTVVGLKSQNRRYFPRVGFRGYASLVTTHHRWPVHLIDLSFNGALVALLHKHDVELGEGVVLTLEGSGGDPIKLHGKIAHINQHYIGIVGRANSIDHQARLRELVGTPDPTVYQKRSLDSFLQDDD